MRYLREHTQLYVVESDEAVTEANSGIWPEDKLKNEILIPRTTNEIIDRDNVIYFASYIPTPLLQAAKEKEFFIILLDIPRKELFARNSKRMREENYNDVSQWFEGQLNNFSDLTAQGIIDRTIQGNKSIEKIAEEIIALTNRKET